MLDAIFSLFKSASARRPFFLRASFAVPVCLLCLLLISGCDCRAGSDDDSDADDHSDDTADDDTASADDATDDSADDDSTDDAADDTLDDDAQSDRLLYVPADVDGSGNPVAVMLTRASDSSVNYDHVSLVSSPGGEIVREGAPVALGASGGANVAVEDFTGDGIAEIAVAWITMNGYGNADTRVDILDPQTLGTARTIGEYENAQAFFGPHIDLDGDGVPELVVRVRPGDDSGGRVHAFDGTADYVDRLDYTAAAGRNAELYALPERSAWLRPGDFSGQGGDEVLIVEYDRSDEAPAVVLYSVSTDGAVTSGDGPFALSAPGAFSVSVRDAEGDGRPETALSVEQDAATVVYFLNDFSAPSRTYNYPAGTSVNVSLVEDLDGDGQHDLDALLLEPSGDHEIDVYLSSNAYASPVRFGPEGDAISLITTPIKPGLYGRGSLPGGDPVFGVLYTTYEAGGPARLDLFSDPNESAIDSIGGLAGEANLIYAEASLRDFNGDGADEFACFLLEHQTAPDSVFRYRLAVFAGTDSPPSFDTSFTDGSVSRGGIWDFDLDGVPEIEILNYGAASGQTPWIEHRSGASSWGEPVLSLTGEAGTDILLYGTAR